MKRYPGMMVAAAVALGGTVILANLAWADETPVEEEIVRAIVDPCNTKLELFVFVFGEENFAFGCPGCTAWMIDSGDDPEDERSNLIKAMKQSNASSYDWLRFMQLMEAAISSAAFSSVFSFGKEIGGVSLSEIARKKGLCDRQDAVGLTRAQRVAIQHGLAKLGHDPGPADGQFGNKTRAAIRAWQNAGDRTATGYLSEGEMEELAEAGARKMKDLATVNTDKRSAKLSAGEIESAAAKGLSLAASRIRASVEANWRRPIGSLRGMKSVLEVRVGRNGEVQNVRTVESSGYARFDESAELAVWKASLLPIPKAPEYYEHIKEFRIKFNPDE